MAYDFDVVVVGGGIVGLSTAYALTRSRPDLSVAVLEKELDFAAHQTGRNSGVIHSGIYYRPGSLKARYATGGAAEMVEFCREHGIAHEVTGKLIVATAVEELPRLRALAERGRANGIPVTELDPAGIRTYEPQVAGVAGLHVATTGICDFPAVARRYAALAEEKGASLRTGNEVREIVRRPDGVIVRTTLAELRCGVLVNCAGLHSDRIARLAGDDPGVRIVPFRGEYYELAEHRRDLVRGLVYPVPDPAFPFLGVHLTRGIHGDVHVGPNAVPALAREGYDWRTVRLRDLAETVRFPVPGRSPDGTGGTRSASCTARCPSGRSRRRSADCCPPSARPTWCRPARACGRRRWRPTARCWTTSPSPGSTRPTPGPPGGWCTC